MCSLCCVLCLFENYSANLFHFILYSRFLSACMRFISVYIRLQTLLSLITSEVCYNLVSFSCIFVSLWKCFAVDRVCLDCGARILGRSDKKFCSDQCRNNFNNRLNRDSNNYVRNVHALLRRNRKVLYDLYCEGHRRIHRDALFAMGYNFSFFTHQVETNEGIRWLFCFEYGFRYIDSDYIELNSNSDYLNPLLTIDDR